MLFILATTEVHRIPATILSRCQRFDFHRIAPEDIAARLHYVAEHENASLDEPAALLIARLADGALRDALSLLDQCLGHSREITVQVVNETAGLAGREHLFELTRAIMEHDSASALETVDRLYRDSKDMARLCEEMTGHFRGMMLVKSMKDPSSLLAMSPEAVSYTHLSFSPDVKTGGATSEVSTNIFENGCFYRRFYSKKGAVQRGQRQQLQFD